jgi:DNA recombination protein Rad52
MTDPSSGGLPQAVLDLLAQPLDLALVRERARDDGSVFAYLEGQAIIDQANRIFGYGGWGAEVIGEPRYQAAEVVDASSGEMLALGMYTVAVRVTVTGCPSRSDVGCGFVTDRSLEGHANATKSATTDGMKRAFRQFGQQFGNSLNERRPGTLASPAKLDDMRQRVVALSGRLGVDEARTRSWFRERCRVDLDEAAERELSSAIKALVSELNEREAQRRKAA